jgi:hypothetical protein
MVLQVIKYSIILLGVKQGHRGYIDFICSPRDIELATVAAHSHHLP